MGEMDCVASAPRTVSLRKSWDTRPDYAGLILLLYTEAAFIKWYSRVYSCLDGTGATPRVVVAPHTFTTISTNEEHVLPKSFQYRFSVEG